MSEYFLKTNFLGVNVKVEIYLSNYATKTDLKNAAVVDTSCFAKETDLALNSNADKLNIDKLKNVPTNLNNLKSEVDKLVIDELVPVCVDLSKLRDIVEILKIKYLALLTEPLILLLMLQ